MEEESQLGLVETCGKHWQHCGFGALSGDSNYVVNVNT